MRKRINKDQIIKITQEIGFVLPKDYLDFITNLKENELESDFNYINFWPIKKLRKYNDECESQKYIPNYFILGTDGGGTALAIHKTTHELYYTEMIGMSEEDIWKIAENFSNFMERFEKEEIEIY